jgi:hypothetical protein
MGVGSSAYAERGHTGGVVGGNFSRPASPTPVPNYKKSQKPDPQKFCAIFWLQSGSAGWSSLAARWVHNPKVSGSNPLPATRFLAYSSAVEQSAVNRSVRGSIPRLPANQTKGASAPFLFWFQLDGSIPESFNGVLILHTMQLVCFFKTPPPPVPLPCAFYIRGSFVSIQ